MQVGKRTLIALSTLTLLFGLAATANADRSAFQKKPAAAPEASGLYEQGVAAAKKGDHAGALKLFEQANKADADNPDVLNMLAFCQRKTGKIDEALANYDKALELRPRFPEAREYRGEAYIQAALGEVEKLRSYGKDGEEQLAKLLAALQAAADAAKAEGSSAHLVRPASDW